MTTPAHRPSLYGDRPSAQEPRDTVRRMLIGTSVAMQNLRATIRLAAGADAPVLLHGPSGAGKEVVARAIHAGSDCAKGPFVAVNCGAIPAELIESELFGHERGSFTGATERRIGRFEQANGGTLFLDEIGDMPAAAQVRLLRVLEERMFERVGGARGIAFSGRIICATHRDLQREITLGHFRQDLWYRIAVLPLIVPPLADRAEDIPALVDHLSHGQTERAAPAFTPDALQRLCAHNWPGNVRELRNLVMRAAILYVGRPVDAGAVDQLLSLDRPFTAHVAPAALPAHPMPMPMPMPMPARIPAAPARPPLLNCADVDAAGVMEKADGPVAGNMDHVDNVVPMDRFAAARADAASAITAPDPDLRSLLENVERQHLRAALAAADGVVADAARMVGLNRTTFLGKMQRHGLDRADDASSTDFFAVGR